MANLSKRRWILIGILLLLWWWAAAYLSGALTGGERHTRPWAEQVASDDDTSTDEDEASEKAEQGQQTKREAFFVDTATVDQLQEDVRITKTGTIDGEQDITVSSQVSWRVTLVRVDQGQRVTKWFTVVRLEDSTGQLTFNAQRAQEWLDQARASYNQTVVSLDKAIVDTELAIRQAQNQANNAELGRASSWASLQLQQLNSQLERAQIDLRNLKQSNDEQLESFEQNVERQFVTIELLYDDVIEATDSILWVTTLRERENDLFEKYLGARNTPTKTLAKQELRQLLLTQDRLEALNQDVGPWTMVSTLETLEEYVAELQWLLDAVDVMLSFTTTGNTFSQAQLSGFNQQINGLRQQVQGQVQALNTQKRGIETFLNTYENNEASVSESIESLEDQIAATRENLESAEVQTDLWVESAQNTYNTALKNKETTLASLQNSIDSAQIAVREAQNQLWKLTIESPITGTIWEVLVDEGQEVGPGTPLFTVISESDQTVTITLTEQEVDRISEWDSVRVTIGSRTVDGTVESIARTTWRTLAYDTQITLDESLPLLWSVARVELPLRSDTALLPLQSVTVLNPTQWIISIYDDGELEERTVELWQIRGQRVEIATPLEDGTKIITSSVKNYDANAFILTENN